MCVGDFTKMVRSYYACRLAQKITVVLSDVDGVFTDNRVLGGAPCKAKWRNYYDGQGVHLLCAIGIQIALVTNVSGDSAKCAEDMVARFNCYPWSPVKLYTGVGGERKVAAAEEFLREIGESFEHCAYMGDDLVDAALLRKAALRAAPAQADIVIREMVHFVSERRGGDGAFRDFANFILAARGIDPLSLPLY